MDTSLLWKEYKANGSKNARDKLIVHYMHLTRFVASKMAVGLPVTVEQDDLESYGIFGLIDAIDKFEPERGFKFETYATSRIKGAIYDELRVVDWVPRSVRTKTKELQAVTVELKAMLNREPTYQEIADAMELPIAKVYELQASFAAPMASLNEFVAGTEESLTLGETIPEVEEKHFSELSDSLGEFLNGDSLGDKEDIILTLYYYEGLTLSVIGELLSITESRVCQIHTKAVLALRAAIL